MLFNYNILLMEEHRVLVANYIMFYLWKNNYFQMSSRNRRMGQIIDDVFMELQDNIYLLDSKMLQLLINLLVRNWKKAEDYRCLFCELVWKSDFEELDFGVRRYCLLNLDLGLKRLEGTLYNTFTMIVRHYLDYF
ncbi:hypothetical protein GLOIN_2v1709349 [Rhizophagus irregularis DAOM 181602=DAOM 197198]|uniref:Uncharacterized protein n=3 Tax=Rhizophagus irregularis TaxID=588596 RepID=A0A015JXT5_RHIIW|nr:hypothetical protein GLOIN_2v1709349 [Rhizophagus irregularis DAOM 181602=DAOM 197198]EXX74352.1 hypothetical protein RirG_051870 [Rhizophagus irregularis DAOM 197198w]POG60867.1 hypothetical protein GLOIN_2v1709349 [Rhizophagus irregularis DAOM 181602=DAOM 197198]GET60187.1 hypothetical protein GLOIN_2v1709349 [Rhizophagus irregularis DAOM 181602=DAOM 197198]|eukprot:XP_025167733.1 hypothetical protein GLOIN_2v1709349 [Rhizophagus irregularis DAOM 181602=DAOM 197198]